MDKRELILVCGMSGAGKTVTMDYFDSAGYYCIDNLPIKALVDTTKALQSEPFFLEYAIAINSNADEETINTVLTKLKSFEWLDVKVLFLDVSGDELLRRFQQTRKHHPFSNRNESLIEAIEQERRLLENLRGRATLVIDTTEFDNEKLKHNLSKIFNREILPKFRLTISSFGYKHGIPQDIDYAFDVRFIENPYYIPELKKKSGNDEEVYNFVLEKKETKDFLELLIPFLDYCISKQKETNRSYLTIGIGCTGGQHRSVTIANYLSDYYSDKYNVIKDHRDVKQM